ncbi:Uncharacterised protein [Mycobacteroides abscessus subsp. abscessus]|nr:Uncharacterised protein [Mycobacteroides abscessus subsp. abscessus]
MSANRLMMRKIFFMGGSFRHFSLGFVLKGGSIQEVFEVLPVVF